MQERSPNQQEQPFEYTENKAFQETQGILKKAKDYLGKIKFGAKVGATLLFSMGVFEVIQAQTNNVDTLDNSIDKIKTGEATLGGAVNQIYENYTETHSDPNTSVIEFNNSLTAGKYKGGIKISGEELSLGTIGDTTKLGDIWVESFSVMGTQNVETDDRDGASTPKTTEESKFFTAVKIQPTDTNGIETTIEKSPVSADGKTPQEAVLSAISIASSLESSTITVVSGTNIENTSDNTGIHSSSKFTEVATSEGNNILKNIRVVIKKDKGRYIAEVFYQ